jgi:hypothetical protein
MTYKKGEILLLEEKYFLVQKDFKKDNDNIGVLVDEEYLLCL